MIHKRLPTNCIQLIPNGFSKGFPFGFPRGLVGGCALLAVVMVSSCNIGCSKPDTNTPATNKQAQPSNSESVAKVEHSKTQKQEPTGNTITPKSNDPKTPTNKKEKKYSEAQLHDNTTVLVLAYQPDIRASYLISNVRMFLDEEQAKKAKAIASTYDWRYIDFRKKRAAILETATDANKSEVAEKLLQIRKDIADLTEEIRHRITIEILTPQQRVKLKQRYSNNGKDDDG